MSKVTAGQIIKGIKELVREDPTFVYTPPTDNGVCLYLDGAGQGSCAFGKVLQRLGVFDKPRTEFEGESITQVLRQLGIRMTGKQEAWMSWFQNSQDSDIAYGEALSRANKVYAR